jgi:DNA-binding transcriptional MerR regulator
MADALHPNPLADGVNAPDELADDRFRSIGEAAAETGVKPHVLRYWEESFSQLRPIKRAGGRRYYRRGDLDIIRHIDDLVNRQGYTFTGARAILAGDDAAPSPVQPPVQPPAPPSAQSPALAPQMPAGLSAHQRQSLLSLRGDLSAMLDALRQITPAA